MSIPSQGLVQETLPKWEGGAVETSRNHENLKLQQFLTANSRVLSFLTLQELSPRANHSDGKGINNLTRQPGLLVTLSQKMSSKNRN